MSLTDIAGYFLVYLLVAGLLAALGVMTIGILKRSGRPVNGRLVAAAFAAMIVLAAGSLLVQQIAVSARPSATAIGSVGWARPAWFAVYGLTLLLSGGLGYVAARSSAMSRGLMGALVASMMTVAFMVAALPLAEFINACFVGEPFLTSHSGCQ